MENEEVVTPEKRRAAAFSALPMLLFTLCAILVIGTLAIARVLQVGTTSAVLDATFTVCNDQGFSGATAYPSTADLHPVIAFTERDGFLQGASNYVKPEWQAEEVEDIELVLCTGAARPAFRSLCDNQSIINQFGLEIEATLREARTAEIVAEGIITSDEIAQATCIEEMPVTLPTSTEISDEAVHDWLAPFVIPAAQ